MGDGTVVVPETFFWILEMPADDVDEWVDRHNDAGLKRIQVIHSHQPRLHVPLVTTEHLVIRLDVWRGNVIFTEQIPVEIRILVAGFLVFIKTESLVISNGERNFFRNIRSVKLRSPVTVICLDERMHGVV